MAEAAAPANSTTTTTEQPAPAAASEENKTKPVEDTESNPTMADPAPSSARTKKITGLLAIISFILSLPVLASVIWLLYMRDYDCERLLKLPRLQIGIAVGLAFVFFINNLALFLRAKYPMPALVVAMVPLLVMLTVGLALVGAYDMESRKIPASPEWFREKIDNNNNWNKIKSCIYNTGTCDELVTKSYTLKPYDFIMSKLSTIESGCCNPPTICGMIYVNATYWRKGNGQIPQGSQHDKDCDIWSNDRTILCYNCQSCRDGFQRKIKGKWWKLGFFFVFMSILLIISHLLLFLSTMWEQFG